MFPETLQRAPFCLQSKGLDDPESKGCSQNGIACVQVLGLDDTKRQLPRIERPFCGQSFFAKVGDLTSLEQSQLIDIDGILRRLAVHLEKANRGVDVGEVALGGSIFFS